MNECRTMVLRELRAQQDIASKAEPNAHGPLMRLLTIGLKTFVDVERLTRQPGTSRDRRAAAH